VVQARQLNWVTHMVERLAPTTCSPPGPRRKVWDVENEGLLNCEYQGMTVRDLAAVGVAISSAKFCGHHASSPVKREERSATHDRTLLTPPLRLERNVVVRVNIIFFEGVKRLARDTQHEAKRVSGLRNGNARSKARARCNVR
jgi:hypothetical protein